MGIRTAWKALFEPEDYYFSPKGYQMDYPYTDEELISELLQIRKRCNIKEIDIIQQAAKKLGWWG